MKFLVTACCGTLGEAKATERAAGRVSPKVLGVTDPEALQPACGWLTWSITARPFNQRVSNWPMQLLSTALAARNRANTYMPLQASIRVCTEPFAACRKFHADVLNNLGLRVMGVSLPFLLERRGRYPALDP